MKLNISFAQLLDEQTFRNVKKAFLLKDYRVNPISDIAVIDEGNNDITIFVEEITTTNKISDGLSFEDEWHESTFKEISLNFYTDYLFISIDELLEKYKIAFSKYLYQHQILETSAIENFSAQKLKSLTEIRTKMNESNHLNQETKARINEIIDKLQNFIGSKYYLKTLYIPNKIQFKLSKIKIVLLFQLLYQNKLIAGHTDDLSRLMDQYFQYEESKDLFKDLKGTQILTRRIKNADTSSTKALAQLETIFKARNFFIVS